MEGPKVQPRESQAAADRGRLSHPAIRKRLELSVVSCRERLYNLQHFGEQQIDRGVRPGAVEAKSRHNDPDQEHGAEDVAAYDEPRRVSGLWAPRLGR